VVGLLRLPEWWWLGSGSLAARLWGEAVLRVRMGVSFEF
jgi:hypothetical protein